MPPSLAMNPGAEVQRPLAAFLTGGVLSSRRLTLAVLPILYWLAHRDRDVSLTEPGGDDRSTDGSPEPTASWPVCTVPPLPDLSLV